MFTIAIMTQTVDVLIIGAGLSGIGAAYHLQEQCPGKTYAILERRAASGGTWDLFRYPGIRSDSDMHTLRAITIMMAATGQTFPARVSFRARSSIPSNGLKTSTMLARGLS